MNREEARELLINISAYDVDNKNIVKQEAMELAIKALEQEPCGSCISRQAAIDLADELKDDLPDDDRLSDMIMSHNEGILEYQTKLSLLPPVTPAEKVGQWITVDKGLIVTSYKCSECGRTVRDDTGYDVTKDYPYCHCGAKMQEVEE